MHRKAGVRTKALMGLIAFGLILTVVEACQRIKAGELAAKNGVSLSGESINLRSYLNHGRGMVDHTYMERLEMGEIPAHMDMMSGDWIYGGKMGGVNCVSSNTRWWPLRLFKSKQRVDIQERVYSSYLEGPKGDRFFIDGQVLFDEAGYLYFTLADVREAMKKTCPK